MLMEKFDISDEQLIPIKSIKILLCKILSSRSSFVINLNKTFQILKKPTEYCATDSDNAAIYYPMTLCSFFFSRSQRVMGRTL